MAEDLGNGGNLLGEKNSLVETRTIIRESGLVQLLENAYKKRTQHQFLRDHQPRLKTEQERFNISVFLQVHQPSFPYY